MLFWQCFCMLFNLESLSISISEGEPTSLRSSKIRGFHNLEYIELPALDLACYEIFQCPKLKLLAHTDKLKYTNVVTINGWCSRDNNTKFEKMLDPIQFSSSSRNGSIFCLRGRAGNSLLLLEFQEMGLAPRKQHKWKRIVWVVVGRRKRP
ncbi:hypothetical protein AAG906_003821 [Vitis piasezkii]